jgi:hypothetical protein
MKIHLLLFIIAIFISCSKSDESYAEIDCLDRLLKEHKMVPYTGSGYSCWSMQIGAFHFFALCSISYQASFVRRSF